MNYTLLDKKEYENMGVTVYLYEHNKTKAEVVYVKSADPNKTFGIGFKTPPTNSKGMAHIMEHSVLNGSKKYKTREPFMDMASSSLQTFLNAMTYPDKTVYPVSSENDKDFYNLTDVYLDAVFNPAILEKKEILDQEGWHYELDDNDIITGVSGVVYNEMKGALTSSDEVVYNDFISHLYKDSPYEYESGGDPKEIYKISYDEFIDFYKTHYHPSNSYIYFYGDLDIDFYLDHLDKEYLSNYEYKNIDIKINVVDNNYDQILYGTYPASNIEDNSDYLLYGFLLDNNLDMKDYLTSLILTSALFNMDSSPIRNKIVEEIDPEYFYARVGYGKRKALILQGQKASGEKIDRFVEIINEGLREASKGINKETLKSAFSIFEYSQREQLISVMRGLTYFLMWDLDKSIYNVFEIVDNLNELRNLINTNYYEEFIEKNFLDPANKLVYVSKADLDYNNKQKQEFDQYIENVNSTISKPELETIKEDLEKLHIHQNKVDSEEEKATIPVLNIEDVETKIETIPRNVVEDKFTYIHHDLDTAGLIYSSLYFDIGHLDLEEIKYLSLINEFLGSVDTKNIKYTQIDDVIWQYLTSPRFSLNFINIDDDKVSNLEKISFTTTIDTSQKAIELMKDFAINSIFDNKKRILEILRMKKSTFESDMYDGGHAIAMNRANSHIDKSMMLKEATSGIESYLFIKDTIKLIKNDYQSFLDKINDIYKKIFSSSLKINITSSVEDFEKIKEIFNKELTGLDKKTANVEIAFTPKPVKEALLSDANVNYVAKTADIKNFGEKYTGSLALTSSILSNPYLYELVRAKGGAYGAGLSASKIGLISLFSYRDPNISQTIDIFKSLDELTSAIEMTNRDFENQQISTMGSILRPKSAQAKGEEDFVRFIKNDPIDSEKLLKGIKESNLDAVKNYSDLFKKAMEKDNICVFGNRDQLNEVITQFDKVIDINN